MKVNWSYVLGVTTLVTCVGLSIYAIKKSKDQEKTDDDSISADEARAEVEKYRQNLYEEAQAIINDIEEDEELEELIEDSRDEASWNASFGVTGERVEVPEEDLKKPEFLYSECVKDVAWIETITEEDKKLKHDPNSAEARNQFIRMELAEWRWDEETYSKLLTLFMHDFEPQNTDDWNLKTNIIDHRVQFFGFGSPWAKEVTMADVILHYGKATVFNLDEDLRYWVNYFLEQTEIVTCQDPDEIYAIVSDLNNHVYHNVDNNSYGIFGLNKEEMDGAEIIAERGINDEVSYDIEFNEFLKTMM